MQGPGTTDDDRGEIAASSGRAVRRRELNAREREQHARAHQEEAERRAAVEPDPGRAHRYQDEAAMHARAAELHAEAAKTQARHAREHSDE